MSQPPISLGAIHWIPIDDVVVNTLNGAANYSGTMHVRYENSAEVAPAPLKL